MPIPASPIGDPLALTPPTRSYWQREEVRRRPSLQGENHVDVAIVGAGLAGLFLAYWLAERTSGKVSAAVVDARHIGMAASGRNGGLLLCGIGGHLSSVARTLGEADTLALNQFTIDNRELTISVIDQEDIDCGLIRDGSFRLGSSVGEEPEIRETAVLLARAGIPVELLDSAAIRERLGAEGFLSGYFLPDDARLHPVRLLRGLADAVERRGTSLFEESPVFGFTRTDSGDIRLRTASGSLTAARVIVASNAYLGLLLPQLGHLVCPRRGQMLTFAPVPGFRVPSGGYAEYGYAYWQQRDDGCLIAGGLRYLAFEEETGFEEASTDFLQERIEAYFVSHFPALKGAPVVERWGGIMGFSPDGLPLIGALPGMETIQLLCGFTGHGLGLACHCAKTLADLLVDGGQPEFPRYFSTRATHRQALFFEE